MFLPVCCVKRVPAHNTLPQPGHARALTRQPRFCSAAIPRNISQQSAHKAARLPAARRAAHNNAAVMVEEEKFDFLDDSAVAAHKWTPLTVTEWRAPRGRTAGVVCNPSAWRRCGRKGSCCHCQAALLRPGKSGKSQL